MMKIDWSTMKDFIDNNAPETRAVTEGSSKIIHVSDGFFEAICRVKSPSADYTDFVDNYESTINHQVKALPSFSDKTIGGKILHRRKYGYTQNIAATSTGIIEINVPYDVCKINEVELIGCEIGDYVDFKVHDDPSGTISGTPNLMLNQYGFAVRMPDGMYKDVSNYDADVIKDMKIKVHYYNSNASAKDVYVNIVFHEVS